jgi:2-polyprenyl-3-methyl-5-hydroxy-6-metoxy-1,4-benzoquinol methylase
MGNENYFAREADAGDERARLDLVQSENDRRTAQLLTAIGIAPGLCCLEVGAGSGSIARWMAGQVGDTGRVVAVDIDTQHLNDLGTLPNVEVRNLDITQSELEPDSYDVAHCRLLLTNVSDPAAALAQMVRSLRPGGWLLTEEVDNSCARAVDDSHPLAEAWTSLFHRWSDYMREAGIIDTAIGRSLPSLLESAGLVNVENEGFSRICRGGDPMALIWVQSMEYTNPRLLSEGVLSEADVETLRKAYLDPTFAFRNPFMQTAWGKKP